MKVIKISTQIKDGRAIYDIDSKYVDVMNTIIEQGQRMVLIEDHPISIDVVKRHNSCENKCEGCDCA